MNSKNILLKSGLIPFVKNKAWEIDLSELCENEKRPEDPKSIRLELTFSEKKIFFFSLKVFSFFDLESKVTRCTDHAGAFIEMRLFKFFLNTGIYDIRHWDRKNKRWEE